MLFLNVRCEKFCRFGGLFPLVTDRPNLKFDLKFDLK